MITYAQNFEDVMLERLFHDKCDGFYIDVGAWHPVLESVTKHFYDKGWHGVNIEPVAREFNKLAHDRPRDTNLQTVVGMRTGRAMFYEFLGTNLSTLDAESPFFARVPCKSYEVDVCTLADVCRAHTNGPIDFLKIDVEGLEGAVIAGGDWQTYRPCVVVIEATAPTSCTPSWESWEPCLLREGYVFVYFDGLNRFYLREESAGLRHHFAVGPNCRDRFVPYKQVVWQRNYLEVCRELEELRARG